MGNKEYIMNLTKRYKVTFLRDGARYKKGDSITVGMAVASRLYADGKIEPTTELIADAKVYGCEELFAKKPGK